MEDVKEVAADDRYALALKTDGTVWAWPGRNTIKHNQQQGLEPSASTPVQIAENMPADDRWKVVCLISLMYFCICFKSRQEIE